MDFNTKLENYAKLVVKIGAGVLKDDIVMIKCPVEGADFARLLAKESYLAGAKEVVVNWSDDTLKLLDYTYSPVEVLEDIPQYLYDKSEYYYKKGAKMISVFATDPELLKDIDSEKIQRASVAANKKMKPLMKYTMNDINSWCVVSIPTESWAKKVLPESKQPVEDLWEKIFSVTRMDEADPVEAWEKHLSFLKEKAQWLNDMDFKELHYKSSNGTDLTIELPEGHIWMAADSVNAKNERFVPNMPTEEVFTLPKRDGVNGVIHSSKPLVYNGNVIDNFALTFKEGKAIKVEAEKGKETLENMIKEDENAAYLGEVALVPYDSPISNSNTLFFNTLFDENASCHLAFGKAYPTNLKGGADMSDEELMKHGVNNSLIHEDFMVGSADMEITGTRRNGEKVAVFKNGNWA